jgi:hypothetical protein
MELTANANSSAARNNSQPLRRSSGQVQQAHVRQRMTVWESHPAENFWLNH